MLAEGRCVVLDGATGTELGEVAGRARSSRSSCGARARCSTHPAAVLDVHRRYVDDRLRRHLHQHLGPRQRPAPRRPAPVGHRGARALDGRRAARAPARAPGGPRGRPRGGVRGGLQPQRGRRHAGGARDRPAARAAVPRGAAGPDPARDAVARAGVDLRDRAEPARHGPPGVAELPALPPRRVRRLRPALGRAGGRRLRARRAPLRGDGRRRAAAQLHPARPRRGHARRGCATSATCRSASIPTSATTPTPAGASTAPSASRSTRSWRSSGARRAPRSSAAAAASARGRSRRRRRPSRTRGRARAARRDAAANGLPAAAPARPAPPWTDARGRTLFPLPFPDIVCDEGVFVPTQGSFLVWRHLFREGVGAGRRCLDVGCGTGLLGVQLALNGAAHVHAIDLDERAAANALTNAFRNGVADRMTAATVDLFPWVPEEAYDVIVASLYPDARGPARAGDHAPAARLLGAQPDRPPDRQAARGARAGRGRLPHAALDHRPAADRRAARGGGLRRARRRLRLLRVPRAVRGQEGARSSASRSCPTPTT